MTPIINTIRLREDHPAIRQKWWAKTIAGRIRRSRCIWASVFLRVWLRQLLQEIRELHADVPPPTGKLERT